MPNIMKDRLTVSLTAQTTSCGKKKSCVLFFQTPGEHITIYTEVVDV